MAKRRLLKFFLSLVILFVVVGVVAVIGAWMLVSRGPSVPDNSTLILRIGGELVESPPNDVFGQVTGGARAQTVRSYVDALRRAKDDRRITSVLIVPTPIESPYWGKVQEIRDAILDFKKSGKRISAYLEYAGEREYYLATRHRQDLSRADERPRRHRRRDLSSVSQGDARQGWRAGGLRENRRLQDRAESAHRHHLYSRAQGDDRVDDARHVRAARQGDRRRAEEKSRRRTRFDRRGPLPRRQGAQRRTGGHAGVRRPARRSRRGQHERHCGRGGVRAQPRAHAAPRRAARRRRLHQRHHRTPATAGSIRSMAKCRDPSGSSRRFDPPARIAACAPSWFASTAPADRASPRT